MNAETMISIVQIVDMVHWYVQDGDMVRLCSLSLSLYIYIYIYTHRETHVNVCGNNLIFVNL